MMSYTSCFRFSTCFLFELACFILSCSLMVHFFFILPLFHSCSIFSELSLNKKEMLCHGFCFDLLYFGSFPHLIFLSCLFIQEWISKKLMEVWVKGLKVNFLSDCVIRWSAVFFFFFFNYSYSIFSGDCSDSVEEALLTSLIKEMILASEGILELQQVSGHSETLAQVKFNFKMHSLNQYVSSE